MRAPSDRPLVRIGLLVLSSTVVLTACFLGLLAVVLGATGPVSGRLPVYVFAMALAFSGTVIGLEQGRYRGRRVIVAAVAVGVTSFVTVSLAAEGVLYASRNPGDVVASELLFYFLAAGLIGTGLGYWGLQHWREFRRTPGL